MKRYILAIVCCVMAIITYAECTTLTGSSVTVSRWGNEYNPVPEEMECWTVNVWNTGYAKITCHIDLELVGAMDYVKLYAVNANNTLQLIETFTAASFVETLYVQSATGRFKVEYWGYYGNCGGMYDGFRIEFETLPNADVVSHDLYVIGKVGVGTTSPTHELDVRGTIRANEIIVNTTGADFVFTEDYQLRPLSEVKAFITENKHLPEIKSAQEMQENGVGVNELQTQLLQKIEELTLYILQQEERIKALEAELNK